MIIKSFVNAAAAAKERPGNYNAGIATHERQATTNITRPSVLLVLFFRSSARVGSCHGVFHQSPISFKRNGHMNRRIIAGREHDNPFIAGIALHGRIGESIAIVIGRNWQIAGAAQGLGQRHLNISDA